MYCILKTLRQPLNFFSFVEGYKIFLKRGIIGMQREEIKWNHKMLKDRGRQKRKTIDQIKQIGVTNMVDVNSNMSIKL